MTGEDDLLAENARLKVTIQNMATFIQTISTGLDRLARALSVESGVIFTTLEQIKAFQNLKNEVQNKNEN